ncbi:MAG: hypothetical protein KKD99_11170 [Proteobacteria bacterium]|nr:hypothetical protein [Pseudomonadota bacterium]MBU4357165.1 hypothetical protein [Pseudomonadota bacterium]MBU4449139.1 hypothetical protein [Pseudomonadota bacterium]
MSLFAVLLPAETPKLIAAIKEKFPDHYEITSTQWMISTKGTAKQISDTLGVSGKEPPTGDAIILTIAGYWGRAEPNLWEWMKVKMEEGADG